VVVQIAQKQGLFFGYCKPKNIKNFHPFPVHLCYNSNDGAYRHCSTVKGVIMDNILFFLTPKAMCAFVYDDYTIRQALEKMEVAGYAALPILNKRGEYRGSITEGDLLWALKNMCYLDMRQAEARKIMEIQRHKDNIPVRVTATMQDLVSRASTQNYVPVVDDKDAFIGLVTRSSIIRYCQQELFSHEKEKTAT